MFRGESYYTAPSSFSFFFGGSCFFSRTGTIYPPREGQLGCNGLDFLHTSEHHDSLQLKTYRKKYFPGSISS